MSNRTIIRAALIVIAGANGMFAQGAVRTVGRPNTSCVSPQYSTINAAISAASAGDEIRVCPGLYPEQLVITKALTIRGIDVAGFNRVVVQPAHLQALDGLPLAAAVSVMNTSNVTIQDLAIDASDNSVTGCDLSLAGVRFFNSSGIVRRTAISGAKLNGSGGSCPALFPGNGFGVHIHANRPGTFHVKVQENTIHDFTRNGVLAVGAGVVADIDANVISGEGPAAGTFQFGVFIADGAVGHVTSNFITQQNCNRLPGDLCFERRSEGVVLRDAGDGTAVDGNTISNVQSGIFINGGDSLQITNNLITNVDVISGIHLQRTTGSTVSGNRIFHVFPISDQASEFLEGCGINAVSGAGNARNRYSMNMVSDSYCGVAHVSSDMVLSGVYINTLYATINSDLYPNAYPPVTFATNSTSLRSSAGR